MRLLDREGELEKLHTALARAAGGRGIVALVTGEAGIGKTSVLRSFIEGIDARLRVLRGGCEDLRVAEPLGPLRDILYDAEPRLMARLHEADHPFALYSDILAACADHSSGTLMVLEDLHWADDATVDFVRFIARRIVEHPIMLAVTARADQTDNRQLIRRALGELPTDALLRIELPPLSKSAVEELCKEKLRDPARVYAASGGNSFYVTELLRNEGDTLPSSVRDAVLARVDRLSGVARDVLEVTSVIPSRAEIEHVEALVTSDVASGIEECLAAGLLSTDGRYLAFQHEIARQAVATSVSRFRLRSIHSDLFARLSDDGAVGLSRLLHHAQGAGDTAAVAALAPQAARSAAAVGSRREAAAFFDLAVETAGDASDADLLEEAAWSNYITGGHSNAADYQLRALRKLDASDPLRKGEALRKLSRYRWLQSDYDGAFNAIHAAISVLSDRNGPELAQAYSSLSQLYMTAYRFDDVNEPAQQALCLAEEFDRPDIRAHALNNLAMSKTHSDTEHARALMSESLEIALRLADPDHAARALINWMTLEHDRCEFRNALDRAEMAAAYSRDQEMDAYLRYSLGMVARAKHRLGRWNEVMEPARRGFEPEDRVPDTFNFNSAFALFMHEVRTGTGPDPDVAAQLALYDHDKAEGQRIGPYAEMMAEKAWLLDEDTGPAIGRLQMVAGKAARPETVAGVLVWLRRLGRELTVEDISLFPEPFRLEMTGDRAGAVRAWSRLGAPYDEALTLAFGTEEEQRQALEIFRRLGAAPAEARLSQVTGATRGRPGRPRAAGPLGLSDRQLDVLRLLDEGMTNARIAEKLFISPKTVDHHVSAILAKLEVSSRGEAAAKARRLSLV